MFCDLLLAHVGKTGIPFNAYEHATYLDDVGVMQIDCFVFEMVKYFLGQQLVPGRIVSACKSFYVFWKMVRFAKLYSGGG